MACSSGCPTQDHATFGACLRSKKIQLADPTAHQFNTGLNKQLDNYVDARRAGIQPDGVGAKQVAAAWKETERTGTPYRGDQITPLSEE